MRFLGLLLALVVAAPAGAAPGTTLPDGRRISPAGFTIPVEGFAAAAVLSPDGNDLAVVGMSVDAVDIVGLKNSVLVDRLPVTGASAVAWTADGIYVARGYDGTIARWSVEPGAKRLALTKRADLSAGPGLIEGLAEDPATHTLAIARTADREVLELDDLSGQAVRRLAADGQPFAVGFSGMTLIATLYNSDHVDAWRAGSDAAVQIATGPHPTQLLALANAVYVSNADGHDVVAIDPATLAVKRRYDLAIAPHAPPGQTPAGLALAPDGRTLYVAESGFNDVAVIDVASGAVRARIPTAWYPAAVAIVSHATGGYKDTRVKQQLWIVSAKGMGSQPDPGGEWDGTYTGIVQHVIVEPEQFAAWTRAVARNNRFNLRLPARSTLPPIAHIVFIVRENKHFDEEFSDMPGVDGDPALLLYGRTYTPNAHALAAHYTIFDNFMTDGEASIYGHAWTTQGMANDYHERNAHLRDDGVAGVDARVAWSIWPYSESGEDHLTPAEMDFDWFKNLADLPKGPRVNVSAIFGPRGELIDELQRKHVGFRVYGEQMTMLPNGTIAPGLAAHADTAYPGDHINFNVLDSVRAKLFLDDVQAHGLASYSYLTLPTDHTAGLRAGFYTPQSYVASNDAALGTIIAGLSKRPEWKNTLVIETYDDAQGTGDHVDSHRMAALMIGPWVRRGYVDHTRYDQSSILRTVELFFGLDPLNTHDAAAAPMVDAFARQPEVTAFHPVAETIPMERNPGKAVSYEMELDGPASRDIPNQEWRAVRGGASLAAHLAYLRAIDGPQTAVAQVDDDR